YGCGQRVLAVFVPHLHGDRSNRSARKQVARNARRRLRRLTFRRVETRVFGAFLVLIGNAVFPYVEEEQGHTTQRPAAAPGLASSRQNSVRIRTEREASLDRFRRPFQLPLRGTLRALRRR